jgi:hypothetical protein
MGEGAFMGMFDTIRAILRCPVCGSVQERWIQTKKGPCLMLNLEVGDTIEPFFYGDYWLEEEWHCDECERNGFLKRSGGNTGTRLSFIASMA